jgi:hypothetical protein
MSLIALLLAVAPQTTPPPPPAPPTVDCTDPDHRAFDFWVGDWDVYVTGKTTLVAHSRIEKIVGCAISETYDQFMGKGGQKVDYHGRSISSYVPDDKGWQQYYVDSSGTAATLKGGLTGTSMIFLSKAGPLTNRMTVAPNADGSVRQHGEFSSDDGQTWQPAYDFTYKKRAAT